MTLVTALEKGECEEAENFITEQLQDTISYFDYAENYYHGFLTGLLSGFSQYAVLPNRESGMGRPDIVLKTEGIRKEGYPVVKKYAICFFRKECMVMEG